MRSFQFIAQAYWHSAASRARDCGNPANLVALAQIRVDRAPDGTRSSRSWPRLRDYMHPSINQLNQPTTGPWFFGLEDFDFWPGSHTWRGKKNGEIYKYWTIVVNIYYC